MVVWRRAVLGLASAARVVRERGFLGYLLLWQDVARAVQSQARVILFFQ